jgi:AmmeMemoRadiSam system protein B
MVVRRPAVAGSFYPYDKAGLERAIAASYLHRLGPGALPLSKEREAQAGLKACICPHAGYVYSGPVAAHSYLDISALSSPELVVIVAPNHEGLGGAAAYGEGEWETPLGLVKVDQDASRRVVELTGFVDVDPSAHAREHSIEVQLPFLQGIYGPSFRFLPISLAYQDKSIARDLGKALAELLKEAAEADAAAVLIGSSDLTHYEPASEAKEKDASLLERVKGMDLDGFYSTLERRNITSCGYGAIATVMETCRLLGYENVRLNKYATSGDVTGNDSSVVGYPSVSFGER